MAVLQGARYLSAPNAGGLLEFPERGAIKAFDGDPSTVWAADRYFHPRERWIEIGFDQRRDVPSVELLPLRDSARSGDRGGRERQALRRAARAQPRSRWTSRTSASVRITLTGVDQPQDTDLRGNGGLREIRIPGVKLRESLRPPVLGRAGARRAATPSRVGLTYLFERTTADAPFRRDRQTGSPLLELAKNRTDAEDQIDRVVFAPAARSYEAERLGAPGGRRARLDARPPRRAARRGRASTRRAASTTCRRHRASSAFDADPDTAWIGIWAPPAAAQPVDLRGGPPGRSWCRACGWSRRALAVRRPTRVRLSWPGGATPPLDVGADGARRAARAGARAPRSA